MSNLTPTRHGAWRVIDGQLVDENEQVLPTAPAGAPAEQIDDTTPPSKGGSKTPSKPSKE